jgi:hypothetical protein
MKSFPLFILSLLPISSVAAQSGNEAERSQAFRSVQELVDAIDKSQKQLDDVRLMLEIVRQVPTEGGKTLKLRSNATIRILKDKDAYLARMDLEMKTPVGPVQLQSYRSPEGLWIHYAGELRGESWLHFPKSLCDRLEKASKVLGSSGGLQQAGGNDPTAFLGGSLIVSLSRSYEVAFGKSMAVDGVDCYRLVFTLKKQSEIPLLMQRGRPTQVQLFIGKKDLMLRRRIELEGEKVYLESKFLGIKIKAGLKKKDLVLEVGKGAQFKDAREDRLSANMIQETLARLIEWEAEQKDKGKNAANSASKVPGKEAKPKDGATRRER